ncbi:MAG: sigma-70 family RNA polymerase sigma factor [Clostridia bacterium]|nr:sigma-70 family RNA polymerase sigma factor [Clostridia bacterium]
MLNNNLSDEQLALLASQGNDEAMALLVARVTPLAKAKAAGYGNLRIAQDDLIQEGMLGFLDAVRSFDADKGVPFKAYAATCINNRILSAIRESLNSKNIVLSNAVSLDDEDNGNKITGVSDPADIFSVNESVEFIRNLIEEELSDFEKDVIKRWLSKKSYSEIADELSCSGKAVDNAMQRIRKKLRSKV